MNFIVEDLGLIEYESAWELQNEYAAQIAEGRRAPTLLLLEHPHVYTFGRRGRAENLLWNESQLEEKNIAVHWVDRGGDVTYHGPGQLVGYPLFPLGALADSNVSRRLTDKAALSQNREILESVFRGDYVGYVRNLEKTLIAALARLGLAAGQRQGKTGVWIQADVYSRCPRCRPEDKKKPAKLAAIGVKVDVRGITRHGFALNVNPDMDYWNGIVACGLQDEPVVALADLLSPVPEMKRVKEEVIRAFEEYF